MSDVPSFQEFNPGLIDWQLKSINDIWHGFDYSKGIHEVLASGQIGSAKSLWAAHNVLRHATTFDKSFSLTGRITREDAEETSVAMMQDHMEGDLIEGEDYEFNKTKLKWTLYNGATISTTYWHKKRFKKYKSRKYSCVWIEEATENDQEWWPAYEHIYERVGRAGIPMNLCLLTTNPDSPGHPIYKRFMIDGAKNEFRHVYYSKTTDNPFIPDFYIRNQMDSMSPIEIQRNIYGQWIADPKGGIYYNYKRERNFRDETYIYDLSRPIDIMCDFNIGVGKPMSWATGQIKDGVFHVAKTYVIDGADTHEILCEIDEDGIFERDTYFRIFGDQTGRSNDTRSKTDDYEIIEDYLKAYRIKSGKKKGKKIYFEEHVPTKNPPIRKRHNKCNAKFSNYEGKTQLYIYKDAEVADEGFRLTKLKKGGQYLEDDTLRQQHVTTAIGYWIVEVIENLDIKISPIEAF